MCIVVGFLLVFVKKNQDCCGEHSQNENHFCNGVWFDSRQGEMKMLGFDQVNLCT